MEWLIILAAALAVALLCLIYLMFCVGRFSFVQSISKGRKWIRRAASFAVLAVLFAVLSLTLTLINAVIVFMHLAAFFLLFELLSLLIRRLSKKNVRFDLTGWPAVLLCVVYLSAGYYLCHNVWQKDYTLTTDKELGSLKIALIADSHLGAVFDGEGFERRLEKIEEQSPDLLVIAGDYVDDGSNREDMITSCEALGRTNFPYGVWFAYGNHDEGYFNDRDFSVQDLENTLRENGVHVMEDSYEVVDDRFIIAGRRDISLGERADMDTLLSGADTDKYIIVIDHEPNDYDNEAASAADLVLSGHTHGGQQIPITNFGKWFGMLDRVYGYENRKGTDFIVTSGIADWEIKFKTGTRSEYVIITVDG